jgi:hypothetical protein
VRDDRDDGRVGDDTDDDPERLELWQVALLTFVGATLMLVLALFGLWVLVVAWWAGATVVWLARLAIGGPVRAAAHQRGPVRTALWVPLVGPFALGATLGAVVEAFG